MWLLTMRVWFTKCTFSKRILYGLRKFHRYTIDPMFRIALLLVPRSNHRWSVCRCFSAQLQNIYKKNRIL